MATCVVTISTGPVGAKRAKQHHAAETKEYVNAIPDDVLVNVLLPKLESGDLCKLAAVSQRFKSIAYTDSRWLELVQSKWGASTAILRKARELAGSWRMVYAAKLAAERDSLPWVKPSDYEIQASIEMLVEERPESQDVGVLFLVDGSGSVQEEDFSAMTSFIERAAVTFKESVPECKVGVVQFSNDVKVEVQPQPIMELDSFRSAITGMVRMNGGTNIATSIHKAGQLLKKNLSADASRVVVLLTDGRVDSYQAREAAATAGRLADEQQGVQVWAFGVGRGVDRSELLRIVGAATQAGARPEDRYLELCVREEVPW
jgi:uncharacterized protein YegL